LVIPIWPHQGKAACSQIAQDLSDLEMEHTMTHAKLTMAALAGFLLAVPAFAQNTPAQKQPTQEGGASTPCNLVANPTADPDCAKFKQRTQNLTPSSVQGAQESTGQKK
jgi:hypothetical protein